MSGNTTLNLGTGGDIIRTEQPGGGVNPKIPVSKIYLGNVDVDDGPVSITNPLPVAITSVTTLEATQVFQYNTITLVASNFLTTVSTYTVPVDKSFYLDGFIASGDTNAIFHLYLNGSQILTARNTVANLTTSILLSGGIRRFIASHLSGGQTVTLKVIHQAAGIQGNFEGTILGQIF